MGVTQRMGVSSHFSDPSTNKVALLQKLGRPAWGWENRVVKTPSRLGNETFRDAHGNLMLAKEMVEDRMEGNCMWLGKTSQNLIVSLPREMV